MRKADKREIAFDQVDNPGNWCEYTFRPKFHESTKNYLYHCMPAGARPVPLDPTSNKRVTGGYEFFYNGWELKDQSVHNCRLGATRENLFPEDRSAKLDIDYLKKMGLTKERVIECDALFFYQLLVPVCDPKLSGIKDDPRMGFYETVAQCTNTYAYGMKNRGGTRGHMFKPTSAPELLVWDGIVIRNLNNNIHDCWMTNQTNTYDGLIARTMHFRRWVDIKSCMKQNMFYLEKDRKDPEYDPTQKYRLIWDVMTHNMNQILLRGGLDVTCDETTWANSSYADVHSRLLGKKTDKGGQHVLLLDSVRRYLYAWTPRHKFFEVKAPFTASGPAEVVRLIDNITPLIMGEEKDDNDNRRQIFQQKIHIAMDNYFSGDEILKSKSQYCANLAINMKRFTRRERLVKVSGT